MDDITPPLPHGTLQDGKAELKAQAKELFETSFLGVTEIAKTLGLKSKTTVIRWRDADGWKRPTDGEVMRQVLGHGPVNTALLPEAPDTPPNEQTCPQEDNENKRVPKARRKKTQAGHIPDTERDTDPGTQADVKPDEEWAESEKYRALAEYVSVDALQEGDAIERAYGASPAELAQVHAKAVKAQLRVAHRIAATGHTILEHIDAVLTGGLCEDGGPGAAATGLSRLTRINPDKETLAGLIKAVSGMMKDAVEIQRTALGMRNDAPRQHGLDAPTPLDISNATKSPALALVLTELDEGMMLKMRDIAKRAQASRPQPGPTIDGAASVVPEDAKEPSP